MNAVIGSVLKTVAGAFISAPVCRVLGQGVQGRHQECLARVEGNGFCADEFSPLFGSGDILVAVEVAQCWLEVIIEERQEAFLAQYV